MIDIEFSVQYLQLLYAAKYPDLLQKAVVPVLEKAASYALIAPEAAERLAEAYRLWSFISGLLSLEQEDIKARMEELSSSTIKLLCNFNAVKDAYALNEKIKQTAQNAALYRLF